MASRVLAKSYGIRVEETLGRFLKNREKLEKRNFNKEKWMERLKSHPNYDVAMQTVKNVFHPFVSKHKEISVDDPV